ncbi:hypothetical protein CANCADRAFT_44929 [Tortispora caseinolytica NRRL Y-17796]|uniref:Uncharacterized protein n=1 Tax=Tortispora caseinolytica NRRL Y-17796 TaxID=767744 RepID=A0A1E4THU2_9ASCO|nr:hypothetical protein CANCADRAFT_44929 [Tortispora caseinolytica NRRL Y-17796]
MARVANQPRARKDHNKGHSGSAHGFLLSGSPAISRPSSLRSPSSGSSNSHYTASNIGSPEKPPSIVSSMNTPESLHRKSLSITSPLEITPVDAAVAANFLSHVVEAQEHEAFLSSPVTNSSAQAALLRSSDIPNSPVPPDSSQTHISSTSLHRALRCKIALILKYSFIQLALKKSTVVGDSVVLPNIDGCYNPLQTIRDRPARNRAGFSGHLDFEVPPLQTSMARQSQGKPKLLWEVSPDEEYADLQWRITNRYNLVNSRQQRLVDVFSGRDTAAPASLTDAAEHASSDTRKKADTPQKFSKGTSDQGDNSSSFSRSQTDDQAESALSVQIESPSETVSNIQFNPLIRRSTNTSDAYTDISPAVAADFLDPDTLRLTKMAEAVTKLSDKLLEKDAFSNAEDDDADTESISAHLNAISAMGRRESSNSQHQSRPESLQASERLELPSINSVKSVLQRTDEHDEKLGNETELTHDNTSSSPWANHFEWQNKSHHEDYDSDSCYDEGFDPHDVGSDSTNIALQEEKRKVTHEVAEQFSEMFRKLSLFNAKCDILSRSAVSTADFCEDHISVLHDQLPQNLASILTANQDFSKMNEKYHASIQNLQCLEQCGNSMSDEAGLALDTPLPTLSRFLGKSRNTINDTTDRLDQIRITADRLGAQVTTTWSVDVLLVSEQLSALEMRAKRHSWALHWGVNMKNMGYVMLDWAVTGLMWTVWAGFMALLAAKKVIHVCFVLVTVPFVSASEEQKEIKQSNGTGI